jgi:hypothetical protein
MILISYTYDTNTHHRFNKVHTNVNPFIIRNAYTVVLDFSA